MIPSTLQKITEEHRVIAKLLDIVEEQIGVVAAGTTADFDLLRLVMRYTGEYPDRVHHPREDVVFALVKRRAPEMAETIDALIGEHAEIPGETARFARLIDLMADDGTMRRSLFVSEGRAYVAIQRRHMERENTVLLPAALAALTAEDWAAAEADTARVEDPLLGGADAGEYRRLREIIFGSASTTP